ncbi:MAG: HDOD domain-containing protein [Desulfobacterales bacterium]|nr:HDOD domain-containing protein [Desulfobacterales bacterium]
MLIMAESMPDEYEKVISEADSCGDGLCTKSKASLLGLNHMEVGEFVTDAWGLPATFNVPIGFHHCPERLACPFDDIEQLTQILHLSSLYIDLFKSSGPRRRLCRDREIHSGLWAQFRHRQIRHRRAGG